MNKFRPVIAVFLVCVVCGAGPVTGQGSGFTWATNVDYSDGMFDRQGNVTGKIAFALRARHSGGLPELGLSFGGRVVGTYIAETTDTAGKFPTLSRLPPTHTSGISDSYSVINEASLNATLTLPGFMAFAQGEYTEVEYPGQDDVQLRKFWVVFGDLDRWPFYIAAGRKTVNFGQFATFSPFTHSHSNHYFWAQSEDVLVEFGYVTDQTELSLTLIPAHRGLRVLSSPANNGAFSNYAVNGSHRFDLDGNTSLKLGAGILRGTIYDSTIAHHPPGVGINRVWNGAWDVNVRLGHRPFDIAAEFTRTLHDWPATGHHVSATTLQARYHAQLLGRPAIWSVSASRGEQGTNGTEWERMEQVIFGIEVEAAPNVRVGAEYMYNAGFVLLIMPTITGDRSVESHTLITGVKLTF